MPHEEVTGSYLAGPVCSGANELRLNLRADHTFSMFGRRPQIGDAWGLIEEGRWRTVGRRLYLQPTAVDQEEVYRIRGSSSVLERAEGIVFQLSFVKENA